MSGYFLTGTPRGADKGGKRGIEGDFLNNCIPAIGRGIIRRLKGRSPTVGRKHAILCGIKKKEVSMKKFSMLCLVVVLVLGVASFAFANGNTEPKAPAKPVGAAVVDVTKVTATVESIDYAKRLVTLKGPEGNMVTFKAGEAVRNLDQVKVGDKVVAVYLESVAVFVRRTTDPPTAGETDMVAVAPKGAKPGVVMVQTAEVAAKVEAIDLKARTLTLIGPEGKTMKVKVDKSVKGLDRLKKGDEIVLRVTDALAITVVRP
jgi:hypothetical protein